MDDPRDARRILLVLLLAVALVFVTRLAVIARIRGWTQRYIPIMRHLLATLLVSSAVAVSLITPPPAWAPALTFVCFTYGLLLAYHITVNMFEGRQIPVLGTRSFWVITVLVGSILVLDLRRGGNHGSFVEGDPFTPTLNYVTSYTLALGILLYLHLRIVGVHWRSVRIHHALTSAVGITYTLRRSTAMAAFMLGAVNLIVLELKLLAAWTGGTWPLLDRVGALNTFTAPAAILLLLASVSFRWLHARIARGIQSSYTRQRRHTAALLTYLQHKMLQVVPTVPHVVVADPQLQWSRALTEIADAREVLWSTEHRTTPITPDEEAARLFRLLQANHQYGRDIRAGSALHPPIEDAAIIAHNVAVAHALQYLEQQHRTSTTQDNTA